MKTRISMTDSAVIGIALGILIAFAPIFGGTLLAGCSTAKANTPEPSESSYSMEVSDSPAPASPYSGVKTSVADSTSNAVATFKVKEPEPEPEAASEEEYYEEPYYEETYYDGGDAYYGGGYAVPYSDMYNSNGPTREMPGWHDGNVETYYSSNVLYHSRTSEWTADEEGFYRDSDGRYVIGVDINSGLQYGDIVETGKGEAVVVDYGAGVSNVHDFYTNW